MLTLCAKNPDLVQRMGENLHKLTEANFDMNKMAGSRIDLYHEVMNARKNQAS